MKAFIFLAVLISLASCKDSYHARIERGDQTLTEVVDVPARDREYFSAVQHCTGAAHVYYIGFDDDGNGKLSSHEVYRSYVLCD